MYILSTKDAGHISSERRIILSSKLKRYNILPYSNSCGPENERISIQTIKLIGTQLDIIEVKDLNRKASEDKDN